jgi:hypothetical protein
MIIEIEYTSRYFTEQLNKFMGSGGEQDIDYKALQSTSYDIDYARKIVTKKFNKKYKFEATLPVEVKKSITLKNVSSL